MAIALGCILGLSALPVEAQLASHPAVDRYNRISRGANVEEWQRRLGDDKVKTRLEAVDSLGTKGGEKAVEPLIEATADADPRVRIKAIDYLGLLGDHRASPVLLQLLFLAGVDHDTKLRVLTALGRIADPDTAGQLMSYAETVPEEDLKCQAVFALGEIGDPSTREGIQKIHAEHEDDTQLGRLCSDALEKITARVAQVPPQEPTILELERKLRPPHPEDQ